MEKLYELIAALGEKHQADKIVLFGSRARGDNKERSDIDLAIYGMPKDKQALFWWDIDDLPTLLKFDLVHVTENTDPELVKNIEKDGVILYEKIENFLKAVQRLKEANDEYLQHPENDIIRDGLIQRFEFTFELSWKASKEYLLDQGVQNELQFPKQVLRAAYENHMIDNDQTWLHMLEARNRTSHIYDDKVAAGIAAAITAEYLAALLQLAEYFKGN